jgi:flagellar export protein FliJ
MASRRFQYPLEAVRLQRQWQVDRLAQELGEARAKVREQQSALAEVQQQAASTRSRWQELASGHGHLSAQDFRAYSAYFGRLSVEADGLKRHLEACEAECETALASYEQARRELRAIDEHQAEMKKEFLAAALAAEVKEADEQWTISQNWRAHPIET